MADGAIDGDASGNVPAGWLAPSERFKVTLAEKLEAISRASMERWLEHPEAVAPGLLESLERARRVLEE
jgi:hypothetical protein